MAAPDESPTRVATSRITDDADVTSIRSGSVQHIRSIGSWRCRLPIRSPSAYLVRKNDIMTVLDARRMQTSTYSFNVRVSESGRRGGEEKEKHHDLKTTRQRTIRLHLDDYGPRQGECLRFLTPFSLVNETVSWVQGTTERSVVCREQLQCQSAKQ